MSEVQRGELRNRSPRFRLSISIICWQIYRAGKCRHALLIRGMKHSKANPRAAAMLEQVWPGSTHQHLPSELSGGDVNASQ